MKTWKNFPYWLRGGLLFAILFLPMILIRGEAGVAIGLTPIFSAWSMLLFAIGFYAVNNFFFHLIAGTSASDTFSYSSDDPQAVAYAAQYLHNSQIALWLTVIVYILIGALLGWLFGKYREKFPGGYGAKKL